MRIGILVLSIPLLCPAAEIPQGSHVALRLVNSITTRTAREGDYVYMTTATPISANDQIVVPVGSYVQGVVSKSVRSGRVSGKAELGIRIETLTLASGNEAGKVIRIAPRLASADSDGSSQKVAGNESGIQQGSNHGDDAKTIATMGGTGAAIGAVVDRSVTGAGIGAGAGGAVGVAIVLLTRGKEVELRQGSTVDVVFDRPIPMD